MWLAELDSERERNDTMSGRAAAQGSLVASKELDGAVVRGDVAAVEKAMRSGVSPDAVWDVWPLLCTAVLVRC